MLKHAIKSLGSSQVQVTGSVIEVSTSCQRLSQLLRQILTVTKRAATGLPEEVSPANQESVYPAARREQAEEDYYHFSDVTFTAKYSENYFSLSGECLG